MQYKTDQKEKFTVLTLLDTTLTSNMVPEMTELTNKLISQHPKNLILNFTEVTHWEEPIMEALSDIQQQFYEQNASFVICALSDTLQNSLNTTIYAELMNITPTETEAWDIVQLEEIERELLDSDDISFTSDN